MRVLVVTNDFPPRPGGIQSFVHAMAERLPAGSVVVYASRWSADRDGRQTRAFDAAQAFPVIRDSSTVLLPTPTVRRRAIDLLRAEDCTAVWFGAAAPLGLLAPSLRAAGAQRIVATTHGHEAGWAQLPGVRRVLRRIADGVDVLTYLGEYTRRRIAAAVGPAAAARMVQLPPGVDDTVFHPGSGGDRLRKGLGWTDDPVIVCVSRLVPRKGQDTLLEALPDIRRRVPGTRLLIVGDGPHRPRLADQVRRLGLADAVHLTGRVSAEDLPAWYGAGDVFAMPCRTRRGGLDVEGLGIVYLEASATGLPVVAGDSGGAPDAVLDGETGYVVPGRSHSAVVDRIATLLSNPDDARAMGDRGRSWVAEHWRWNILAGRLERLLTGDPVLPDGADGRQPTNGT